MTFSDLKHCPGIIVTSSFFLSIIIFSNLQPANAYVLILVIRLPILKVPSKFTHPSKANGPIEVTLLLLLMQLMLYLFDSLKVYTF